MDMSAPRGVAALSVPGVAYRTRETTSARANPSPSPILTRYVDGPEVARAEVAASSGISGSGGLAFVVSTRLRDPPQVD